MAKKTAKEKANAKATATARSERPVGRKLPVMLLSEYLVPDTITLTFTRHEALALSGAIEGAIARAQQSLHPLLSSDVRTLERATYQLIGMAVPDWLEEKNQ